MPRSASSLLALGLLPFALTACGSAEEPTLDDGAVGEAEQTVCTPNMSVTFGTADNFVGGPDPLPYAPTALPEFVNFLAANSIPVSQLKTLDDATSNRHTVATLRHGLRSCFTQTPFCALTLCAHARALPTAPQKDSITVYDTDFGTYSFPVIASTTVVPALAPTWNPGQTAFLCMPLPITSVGDMLQFRMQNSSMVDFIRINLSC